MTPEADLLARMLATPVRYIQRIGGERFGREVARLRMLIDPPAFCQFPGCGAALLYSCKGCVPKSVERKEPEA